MVSTMADPQTNPQGNAGLQLFKAEKFTSNNQTAQSILKGGLSGNNISTNQSAIPNTRASVLAQQHNPPGQVASRSQDKNYNSKLPQVAGTGAASDQASQQTKLTVGQTRTSLSRVAGVNITNQKLPQQISKNGSQLQKSYNSPMSPLNAELISKQLNQLKSREANHQK